MQHIIGNVKIVVEHGLQEGLISVPLKGNVVMEIMFGIVTKKIKKPQQSRGFFILLDKNLKWYYYVLRGGDKNDFYSKNE